MAFPTTSVLTNFTGPDENPLSEGGAWNGPVRSGQGAVQRVSNQADTTVGAASERYWDTSFAADQEVFAMLAVLPNAGQGVGLYARLQSEGTAGVDAYQLSWDSTNGFRVFSVVNAGFTQVGAAFSQAMSAGDSWGMSVIGTTIEVWYKPSAGSWTSQGTRTSATVSGAGKIGMGLTNNGPEKIDDFGGGAVAADQGLAWIVA